MIGEIRIDILIKSQFHFKQQVNGHELLSGSYGVLWVMDIFSFFLCSYQTQYAPNAEPLLILAQFLTKENAWMIISADWDWHVSGRGLSAPNRHFSVVFDRDSIRFLAQFIEIDSIRIELNNFTERLDGKPNATLLLGNKHFYTSDYQIHRRANWASGIKLQSIRTLPTECINGENQKAEHVAQGTLNLFTTNTNDYDYIFPLLDWQAINGITVEHDIPLEPCIHGAFYWKKLSLVGGVSHGQYGLAIMDTASHNLTAQRSWYFYDDVIIALATNLILTTPTTAWTTLASRLLTIGQISVIYCKDKVYIPNWVLIGVTKTENYDIIGLFNYTVTERLLTIWINHR